MSWRAGVCLVTVVGSLASVPRHAQAFCIPEVEYGVCLAKRPEDPLEAFAAGRVGVLQPGWATSYLVVAYRHLAGSGLDPSAQADVVALWQRRMEAGPDGSLGSAIEEWLEARRGVGEEGPPDTIRPYGRREYRHFVNCAPGAFRTAAQTFMRKLAEGGRESGRAREWARAQDLVFGNCGSSGPGSAVVAPPELPTSASARDRADRLYQIASAYFYAGDLAAAESRFRAIARDPRSPWRGLAPYLAVRCLIRRGELEETGPMRPSWIAAERELLALGPRVPPGVEPAVERHLTYLEARLRPAETFCVLGRRLAAPGAGDGFAEGLERYTWLLDQAPNLLPDPADDLGLWIAGIRSDAPQEIDVSLARFRDTGSLAWLASCLRHLRPGHPAEAEILRAASRVPYSSPAWPMAFYHRARLLADAGCDAELHSLLESMPADSEGLGSAGENLVRQLRTPRARSLDEFVASAPRRGFTTEFGDERSYRLVPLFLDDETRAILVRDLPQERIEEIVNGGSPLGRLLSGFSRVRRLLLGRESLEDAADELERRVARFRELLVSTSLGPQAPSFEKREEYRAATWCALERPPVAELPPLPFLRADEVSAAAGENERIRLLGSAASLLCREALWVARTHPKDPRSAELLHLAVRNTRLACADADTPRVAREAFRLLHSRWGRTQWAAKTPRWYGGR